jgi:hypothetical protein
MGQQLNVDAGHGATAVASGSLKLGCIRVAAGENVRITRHGKPVAEITAVKAPRNQLDDLALTDAAGTEGTRTGLLTAESFTVLGVGFAIPHGDPVRGSAC